MTQENTQNTLHTLSQRILTKRNGKIVLALAVVCVLAAGGGKYYLHQQHVAHHEQRLAAISQMVQAQAVQHNVTLLSEDHAKAAAAQALGQDESSLTFKEVALLDLDQMKHGDKAKHEKFKKAHGGEPGHEEKGGPGRDSRPDGPAPQPGQAPQNSQNAQGQKADAAAGASGKQVQRPFRPMYAIRATDGQVKYNVLLDAVSGSIIDSRVI